MTFSILAPDLNDGDARLLRAALSHCHLPYPEPATRLSDCGRLVLSVGKAGLDGWHQYGLVHVGANHGETYTHRARDGRKHTIMVVQHPGAMAQLSMTKHSAREDMVRDLTRWRDVVDSNGRTTYGPVMCGGCQKSRRVTRVMPGVHVAEELDGVMLCEDHWRRRAQYKVKEARMKAKDKGKMEHQIPGQGEMLPGDGTQVRVMVKKNG